MVQIRASAHIRNPLTFPFMLFSRGKKNTRTQFNHFLGKPHFLNLPINMLTQSQKQLAQSYSAKMRVRPSVPVTAHPLFPVNVVYLL